MPHFLVVILVLASGVVSSSYASAQSLAPAPAAAAERPAPNDYGSTDAWLCRPGRTDACSVDLASTLVAADGRVTREAFTPNPAAPIDCFYVYPTVSPDRGEYSDMQPNPAELNVVRQQFARFASVCRLYAPLYRQVTLGGLRGRMASGNIVGLDQGLGYDDVQDAWRHYLERENQGRGVVLIGHSQGSFVLARLIREEIEGGPVQPRLVSAILLDATVTVPKGQDVGGSFASVPVCLSASQVGCVIAYASFRSTRPPPATTLFGHVDDQRLEAIRNEE